MRRILLPLAAVSLLCLAFASESSAAACTTTVSSLSAAGTALKESGSPVVCLTAGTYAANVTKSEEQCSFGVPECWIIKGPTSGTATLKPETPGTVTITGSASGSTVAILGSKLVIEGLTLPGVDVGLNVFADRHTNPTEVTLLNDKGRNFTILSATHITVEGGEWGPSSCDPVGDGRSLAEKETDPGYPGGNNSIREVAEHENEPNFITIKNTVIHDVQSYKLAGTGECHTEGLAIFGGKNITVVGTTFYNDSVKDIFSQFNESNEPEKLVIEKNWLAAPVDTTGNNGHAAPYLQTESLADTLSLETHKAITLRANHVNGGLTFNEVEGSHALSETSVLYNFAEFGSVCNTGATYTENVWKSATKCNASDRNVAELPFVNHKNDSGLNYGLTGEFVGWPE